MCTCNILVFFSSCRVRFGFSDVAVCRLKFCVYYFPIKRLHLLQSSFFLGFLTCFLPLSPREKTNSATEAVVLVCFLEFFILPGKAMCKKRKSLRLSLVHIFHQNVDHSSLMYILQCEQTIIVIHFVAFFGEKENFFELSPTASGRK